MPIRKGAIYKICAAGLSADAVGAKGTGVAAGITAFLEVGSKLVDIGGVTAEAQQADLQGILTQHVDRVETALAGWFDHEFGGTRSQRRDAEAALVAMDAILSDCLPSPVQITSADLDPKKIAAIVADAMGQRDSSFAVPPVAGELTVQRRVALQLVEMAFRNALGRVEVFDKLAPVPPNGWAAVRYGLGNSLLLLGMLTNCTDHLEQALGCYTAAKDGFAQAGLESLREITQQRMMLVANALRGSM